MSKAYCCDDMKRQAAFSCKEHKDPFDCPDSLIAYNRMFDEYGLVIHDGGTSTLGISFCPWCGSTLPESKRDRWFDELEALGFNEPREQNIPKEYLSDEWYK